MNYNKLVRDKIIERIESKGEKAVFHIADEAEYWQKLKEKFLEEFEEFKSDGSLEEMADLMEVLDAMIAHKGFDRETLEMVKIKKAEERGRFEKRIILDES